MREDIAAEGEQSDGTDDDVVGKGQACARSRQGPLQGEGASFALTLAPAPTKLPFALRTLSHKCS